MTIEERAHKHYGTWIGIDAYTLGAEEQRDIERKNFYKAYCSLCPCYMDGCAGECDKLEYLKHIIEHEDKHI